MKLQLIRNATLRLEYAGRRLLIDPFLAEKFSRPSYRGRSPNPLVDLPIPPEGVIEGSELVLVSHLHSDHFDPAAQAMVPKELPLLCQPEDEAKIVEMGFRQVVPLADSLGWEGITVTRVPGRHGSGEVLKQMGRTSGFLFRAEGEPTVYWCGDTVWYEGVAGLIARQKPAIIITHSCGAVWGDGVLIVMDAAQTVAVCRAAPESIVVATHMEALDHATVSRQELRHYADEMGIRPEQLLIPADGETLQF